MTDQESGKAGKWHGLIFAIQFLTILPIPSGRPFNAGKALAFFPICGLLIGGLLLAVDTVASQFWPRPAVAVLDILFLVILTGALHIDGLADTFDGLYGVRDPEAALRIMKDSRIGAMGLVAVVCCLAVKWAGLTHMADRFQIWLLLVPAYARATIAIGTKALPYGRSQDGTAHAFFQAPIHLRDFWGIALVVLLSAFAGWGAIVLNLGFMIVVILLLTWYRRKIGCVTGDLLGAMIEITEAGLFMLAAMRWGH